MFKGPASLVPKFPSPGSGIGPWNEAEINVIISSSLSEGASVSSSHISSYGGSTFSVTTSEEGFERVSIRSDRGAVWGGVEEGEGKGGGGGRRGGGGVKAGEGKGEG